MEEEEEEEDDITEEDLQKVTNELKTRKEIRQGAILSKPVFDLVKKKDPMATIPYSLELLIDTMVMFSSYTASCNSAFPSTIVSYMNTIAYLKSIKNDRINKATDIANLQSVLSDPNVTLYTLFGTIGVDTWYGRMHMLRQLVIPNNPIPNNETSETMQRERISQLNIELRNMKLQNEKLEQQLKEASVTKLEPLNQPPEKLIKTIQQATQQLQEQQKNPTTTPTPPNLDETLKTIQQSIKKLQEKSTKTTVTGGKTGADLTIDNQKLIRTFMCHDKESELTQENIDDLRNFVYAFPQFALTVYAKFPNIITIK